MTSKYDNTTRTKTIDVTFWRASVTPSELPSVLRELADMVEGEPSAPRSIEVEVFTTDRGGPRRVQMVNVGVDWRYVSIEGSSDEA